MNKSGRSKAPRGKAPKAPPRGVGRGCFPPYWGRGQCLLR